MNVIMKGTDVDKTVPEKNAMTAILDALFLLMIGNRVSIAVAPATEMDSQEPIYFAMKGTEKIAIISLKRFVKKAKLPNSTLILESMIDDNEAQPSPILTANPSLISMLLNEVATIAPMSVPIIVHIGKNQIRLPHLFRFFIIFSLFPMSMPTKKRRRHKPILINILLWLIIRSTRKKTPEKIPTIKAMAITNMVLANLQTSKKCLCLYILKKSKMFIFISRNQLLSLLVLEFLENIL